MFGYKMNEYDKRIYEEELKDFLPDKMIDMHNHVYKAEFKKNIKRASGVVSWTGMVAKDCEIEDLLQTYKDMFPGKTIKPAIMGSPTANLKIGNEYIENAAKENGLSCYYCISYDTPTEEIEEALTKKGFCGVKPYLQNRPLHIPGSEVRIFDFMTHEQFEIVNKLKGIVILHIGRDGRLKDPVNYMQLLEIEEKYPDLQLVVAHIGRAYAPEDIGDAFDYLKNTKNMMFDFCANTLSEAMYRCIEAVGTKRLMFGTDMPIAKMRMRRVTKNGFYYNIVPKGLYGDVSGDPHMIEAEDGSEITNFTYEQMRSFKRTAEQLKLTKREINDICYQNAANMLNARGGNY